MDGGKTEFGRPERIGLLFVHGMGEQERWAHLHSSVVELAELLRHTGDDKASVSVVDRTAGWELPPDRPHPGGIAPITLQYRSAARRIDYDCHEVWWADLGERSGVGDAIRFWLWGLGQWLAPIYCELDASHQSQAAPEMVHVPRSVAGDLRLEPWARLQLLLAALAALFVTCTWSLAKRLISGLSGVAPLPTLIVRYVGDVRLYETRATPGDSPVSDPGHPRRVAIRRRMVTQMVALGAGDHDRWYVLAHSLGTVVAYNGLTETGHCLPNYLPQDQWERLPHRLKEDEGCLRRPDVHAMMPSRPGWLGDHDVINRPELFRNLRGLLTYGSPLDKFAGLWPRIVATATDRKPLDPQTPFSACEWVNLNAPTDPVAGALDSFAIKPTGSTPTPINVRTSWSWAFGLSHIHYLRGFERYARSDPRAQQKLAIAQWLLGAAAPEDNGRLGLGGRLLAFGVYVLMIVGLWLLTAVVLAFVRAAVDSLVGAGALTFEALIRKSELVLPSLGIIAGGAHGLILFCGLYRWIREARLNERLAVADERLDVARMLGRQHVAGLVVAALAALLFAPAALLDLVEPGRFGGWRMFAVAVPFVGIAAWTQTLITRAHQQAVSAGTVAAAGVAAARQADGLRDAP
jgi:hypothetical protein